KRRNLILVWVKIKSNQKKKSPNSASHSSNLVGCGFVFSVCQKIFHLFILFTGQHLPLFEGPLSPH
uniref:Uncharacterized protein n=1 Tax=Nothoprocta perdicaria TaxID=30464 RepID=A0A8C6YKK4_NOTPE